jgi:hypothetical protein
MPMILAVALAAAQQSLPLHEPRRERTYTPIGTRLPQPVVEEPLESQQRAAEVLQKFAACVVDGEPARTAAVVDPPTGTADTVRRAALRRIEGRMSYCLGKQNGGRMEMALPPLVGTFASELYRRRWPSLPPLGSSPVPPSDHPDNLAYRLTLGSADCLVDKNAAAADALVRSSVRSSEEKAALAKLAPFYGGCLAAGTTLSATRLALRAAIGLQLYRRALAGQARP